MLMNTCMPSFKHKTVGGGNKGNVCTIFFASFGYFLVAQDMGEGPASNAIPDLSAKRW